MKLTSRSRFLKILGAGMALAGFAGTGISCGPSLSQKLAVEPARVRGDEPFVVGLRDLPPGERVVLSAAFESADGAEWSSTAIFEADDNGRVDTARQVPVEGSYIVEDPMGLVWSALGGGEYLPSLRPPPMRVRVEVGNEQATARVERYVLADGVREIEVREDGLAGTLFLPATSKPSPAVLVFGGSDGGLAPYTLREAALLASEGFAALALAYFKGRYWDEDLPESLPDELSRIPLEYFEKALEWVERRDEIDGERLGVIGHSRGGELALLLGSRYPELKAVVSYVGSGVITPAYPEISQPAWTYRGEAVSTVPRAFTEGLSEVTEEQRERAEKEAEIPVENTNGPVLLIAGGEDATWDSERFSRIAMDRLERNDRAFDDSLRVYPKAGHEIQAPYLPVIHSGRSGGEPASNAQANEDSWARVLQMLDGALGD